MAGYLRKHGYSPIIVDAIGEGLNKTWPLKKYPGYTCQGLTFDEILDRLPADIQVFGFSGMFSGEWPVMRDLVTEVRRRFPRALIVAGGEHATALTEYSLRDCPALDVCVRGEAEHPFFELLESYAETGDFTTISGIGYLDEHGEYHENGDLPRFRKIDDIPWPHWPEGYLEKFWSAGKSYGTRTERDMPFLFSRGCPYRCTFCSSPQMWTTRYILRDIEDVIAEIKHYMDAYDVTSIQLYDLTAITKRRWLVEFCNRVLEEGIELSWSVPSGTRSEVLDNEVIGLLKKTGCTYLVYASESGSTRTLKYIKKQVKLERLTASVLEARRQGLTTRINLIIGFPSETWKDVVQTLWYGMKMSALGVDEVPIFVYSPYPGTEIFKELQATGEVTLNDEYFLNLTSINGNYLSVNVVSHNHRIAARTLGIVRMLSILGTYGISYILRPHRILRTVKNLATGRQAATVFEHRLSDLINKWRTVRSSG